MGLSGLRIHGSRLLAVGLLVALMAPGAWAAYDSKGKRDPFVPLVTPEGRRIYPPGLDEEVISGVAGLVLHGIVYESGDQSMAIINGQILKKGQQLDGMKVLEITPTSVTMQIEGKPHLLRLESSEKETEKP